MKKAATLLHLIWAGSVSFYMLWISTPGLSWSYVRQEPFALLLPLLASIWIIFAVGLFLGSLWAWFGCFVFTIFSLFTGVWFSLQAVILQIQGELAFDLSESLSRLLCLLRCCRHAIPILTDMKKPPNRGAVTIRSGWGAAEKNVARGERFAVGGPSLRAQTSPLPGLSAVAKVVAALSIR